MQASLSQKQMVPQVGTYREAATDDAKSHSEAAEQRSMFQVHMNGTRSMEDVEYNAGDESSPEASPDRHRLAP